MGLVAIIGFVAGTRSDMIIGAVAPAFGFKVATGTIDLSSVQDTYRNLKANFDGKLDEQKLIDGASRGLVAAAGDQYTIYMDKTEADAFNKDLSGDIGGGIGAEIGLRDNKPTIIRTLKDTPAEKAGLAAGDTVIAINDQAVTSGATVDDVVKKIRGDVGTTVKVTVLRDNEQKDFTITRETISSPSVESKIDGDTGILTLSRFDEQTSSGAKAAAQDFKDKGVKKVILDLRGNGGGYLTAAQDVAGLWLNDQVVVTERTDGKITDTLKSGTTPILAGIPTVVLVNGGSASASEIVAGALQDHHAATLVGEKTFGKGSVQKLLNLTRDSVLKVTVAKWYTPNGKNINKEGITPDKTVVLTRDDANAGRDPQLDAAKQALN
jgi:carboxyl-terminal processing protease